MLSSKDIRNVKFSNAIRGYKQEEVDVLLDKIESDYEQFERIAQELQSKNEELKKEIEGFKASQSSIQNVLVSAQTLADQIVGEAKAKSEQIVQNAEASIELLTLREKKLSDEIEQRLNDKRAAAEKEIEAIMVSSEKRKLSIEKAIEDSVLRQQTLYDRLRLEIAAFKSDVTLKYKEHLEMLQKLPDSVPMDPKSISAAVTEALNNAPAPETFIQNDDYSNSSDDIYSDEKPSSDSTDSDDSDNGFSINGFKPDDL